MKIIDPGHSYLLNSLDGGDSIQLTFVKREGNKYPGNVGSYPGTNIQEVMRAIIERLQYLNNQIPCNENIECIRNARSIILLLEDRAADRHGRHRVDFNSLDIENYPVCSKCGHIGCYENCK